MIHERKLQNARLSGEKKQQAPALSFLIIKQAFCT